MVLCSVRSSHPWWMLLGFVPPDGPRAWPLARL
jgi:hypothetical protein